MDKMLGIPLVSDELWTGVDIIVSSSVTSNSECGQPLVSISTHYAHTLTGVVSVLLMNPIYITDTCYLCWPS